MASYLNLGISVKPPLQHVFKGITTGHLGFKTTFWQKKKETLQLPTLIITNATANVKLKNEDSGTRLACLCFRRRAGPASWQPVFIFMRRGALVALQPGNSVVMLNGYRKPFR
jgi:hypothetical protein